MKQVLFLAMCLSPALTLGQSPFNGHWKTDMSKSKLSQKPLVFSVNKGTYQCESCAPTINVKADGADQSVSGQTYDTVAITASDPNSIHVVTKKGGKTANDVTRTVSGNGNTLTIVANNYSADGNSVKIQSKWARVSKGPAGSHAASGSWRVRSANEDDAGLTTTWKVAGDDVSFSDGAGVNWTAKSGGGAVPVKGRTYEETVSVKTMGTREMLVTYMREGKPFVVEKMTVSADGKTMTTVSENKWAKTQSTFYDVKQ